MAISGMYGNGKGRAIHLLRAYLQKAYVAAGLPWDESNDADMGEIVDCILNEARAQAHDEIEEWVQPEAQVQP